MEILGYDKIPEQYIALASFEFGWTKKEVEIVRKMWKNNDSLEDIVNAVRPGEKGSYEVMLLIFDQLYKKFIKPRKKSIVIGGLND